MHSSMRDQHDRTIPKGDAASPTHRSIASPREMKANEANAVYACAAVGPSDLVNPLPETAD
jgi:hypothetical protein